MTTLELQDLNDMVYFKLTRAFSRGLVSFGQLMRGIRLFNRNVERQAVELDEETECLHEDMQLSKDRRYDSWCPDCDSYFYDRDPMDRDGD